MAGTLSKNGSAKSDNRVSEAIQLRIQPLNIGRLRLELVGTSPLMVHNFSNKARREMLEQQTKQNKKTKKEPRCLREEFFGAFYVVDGPFLRPDPENPTLMLATPEPIIDEATKEKTFREADIARFLSESVFGVPITGFKNAMISACRNTDYTMAAMKQTLFVTGDQHRDWAIIDSESHPDMDTRMCRLKNGTPIERYRPRWDTWRTTINVEWDANVMSADEIGNLVSLAGFYVGICEGRPEKSSIGYGRWKLVSSNDK